MKIVTVIVNFVVAHQWTGLLGIPGVIGILFWKATRRAETITAKLGFCAAQVIAIASVAAVSFVSPEIGTLSVRVNAGTVEQITAADIEINFHMQAFEQRQGVLFVTDESGRELYGLVPFRGGP